MTPTLSDWLSAHAIPGDDLFDIPTDAEMSRWQSVGDVELWMANVGVRV